MAEPTRLHIKRRATDDAPDYLVLQGGSTSETSTQVRYIKKQKSKIVTGGQQEPKFAEPTPLKKLAAVRTEDQKRKARSRTFYLTTSPPSSTGKRKGREDGVATFAERKRSRQHDGEVVQQTTEVQEPTTSPDVVATPTFKRPGRGSALNPSAATKASTVEATETEEDKQTLQAMADYMHQATLDEIEMSKPKPKVTTPTLSGAAAREMHRRRVAANKANSITRDSSPESDEEYVYDTYFLAPNISTAMDIDKEGGEVEKVEQDNVGYLVIAEENQTLWQTYLEDEDSDKETYSDDEDENAEDYYGADYPEDEVASDDEFDRNPYGYRGRAEDDEEYDEETGEHSGDEEEDAYERMMNPFSGESGGYKMPAALAKFLKDGDDSD